MQGEAYVVHKSSPAVSPEKAGKAIFVLPGEQCAQRGNRHLIHYRY